MSTECPPSDIECPPSDGECPSSVYRVTSSVRRVSTEYPVCQRVINLPLNLVTFLLSHGCLHHQSHRVSSVECLSSVCRVSLDEHSMSLGGHWMDTRCHSTDTRRHSEVTRWTLDVTRRSLDGHSMDTRRMGITLMGIICIVTS